MKQIRLLAQYYVDLMMKLGLVRFSMLLALALVVLAIVVQMAVTMVLHGQVESIDVIRSIFFGLLITPWAVYFLSVVVEQLEESRQRLSRLVQKLEEMRERDLSLNVQLKDNIAQLNQEIAVREKAEAELQETFGQLKIEIKEREETQIQLEQQSSFLRSFLDASPDLVFYRNEDKEFSGCNRAMELLTGKSEKQLVHLKPADVYSPEAAAKVIETDEKVFRHNVSLTYEQWLDYPDGRKACFEIRKVPYYDRVGKRHGLMGFGRDITERKRYQDALEISPASLPIWKISPHCRRNKKDCALIWSRRCHYRIRSLPTGRVYGRSCGTSSVTPSNSLSKARLPCACATMKAICCILKWKTLVSAFRRMSWIKSLPCITR